MKKMIMIALLFALSISAKAQEVPSVIVMMFPHGEKEYCNTTVKGIYEYPSLIKDSSINSYGKSYTLITKCKIQDSDDFDKRDFKLCSFDTLGNFTGFTVLAMFRTLTTAKLWLSDYNESEVFATSFNFSDIDLLNTDKYYYVYDKKNEVYLTIYSLDRSDRIALSVKATFDMPIGLKKIIDDAKAEEAAKSKKTKSKKKK